MIQTLINLIIFVETHEIYEMLRKFLSLKQLYHTFYLGEILNKNQTKYQILTIDAFCHHN
jgi:hypothetical protein